MTFSYADHRKSLGRRRHDTDRLNELSLHAGQPSALRPGLMPSFSSIAPAGMSQPSWSGPNNITLVPLPPRPRIQWPTPAHSSHDERIFRSALGRRDPNALGFKVLPDRRPSAANAPAPPEGLAGRNGAGAGVRHRGVTYARSGAGTRLCASVSVGNIGVRQRTISSGAFLREATRPSSRSSRYKLMPVTGSEVPCIL